jgi:threonylcarbamoyladenosine tRNA methylthiotransferase MtaB
MGEKRACILTLGCKVNQFEGEAMEEALEAAAWELVPFGPQADCIIINTCVVTARAQADSRRWISRAKRTNPAGLLLAAGCYPQIDPEGVLSLGVDGMVGNQEKGGIAAIAEEVRRKNRPVIRVGAIKDAETMPDLKVPRFRRHTRAFLKIQDGCDAHCSYCIVPLARGRSRSLPPSQVIASLRQLAAAGFQEAVLSGIHLGAYGLDLHPATTLLDLVKQIEGEQAPPRIRLSSLEPREATPELIDWIASARKPCPHLHLPLQSGADEILGLMNRPYTAEFFHDLVLRIAAQIPSAAIGCDVIVGFPGEDEQAFGRTYDLLQALPVSYLHCFPFSPRLGTPAARMAGQVSAGEKQERIRALRCLSREKRQAFYSLFLNQPLPFLIEHRRQGEQLRGIARNYLFCLFEGGDELMGREVEAVPLAIHGEQGIGRIKGLAGSSPLSQPCCPGQRPCHGSEDEGDDRLYGMR